MLNIKNWFITKYEQAKAWFLHSETIFWARLQVVAGFLTGVISSIDWSNLSTLDFTTITKSQAFWVAVGLVVNGVITEALRRRNSNL